ncbi:MAG: response regulator transcription factor [Acidobacteriota bacterium]|nr:MAG: response regulator transcription factor [Acidobacteriota bacterium]
MTPARKILIVDDDPQIREIVRFALQREGFLTAEAGDGVEALRAFDEHGPDLVILDILMPELDGSEVCRALRAHSRAPIIFLSSKDEEIDRILGLEIGGDDYVTKPFSPRELVARVRAVLRRLEPRDDGAVKASGKSLRHRGLRLDLDRHRVFWNEQEIVLTVTEFGLLRTLLSYPGKVFSREELMEGAYAYDNIVTARTIDSHIRRIRRKLAAVGTAAIETVHGIGYKLSE